MKMYHGLEKSWELIKMSRDLLKEFKPYFSGLDLTDDGTRKTIGNIFDLAHAFLRIESMTQI